MYIPPKAPVLPRPERGGNLIGDSLEFTESFPPSLADRISSSQLFFLNKTESP